MSGLTATIYFRLKQQIFGNGKQFQAARRYGITAKCLSELLHGRKYLGGKQQAALSAVDDPEYIDNDKEEKSWRMWWEREKRWTPSRIISKQEKKEQMMMTHNDNDDDPPKKKLFMTKNPHKQKIVVPQEQGWKQINFDMCSYWSGSSISEQLPGNKSGSRIKKTQGCKIANFIN